MRHVIIYISSDEDLERFLNDEDAVVMIDQYISKLEMVRCTLVGVEVTEKKDPFNGINNFFLVVAFLCLLTYRSKISSQRCSHCLNAMKSKQVLPVQTFCLNLASVFLVHVSLFPIRTEYEP